MGTHSRGRAWGEAITAREVGDPLLNFREPLSPPSEVGGQHLSQGAPRVAGAAQTRVRKARAAEMPLTAPIIPLIVSSADSSRVTRQDLPSLATGMFTLAVEGCQLFGSTTSLPQ